MSAPALQLDRLEAAVFDLDGVLTDTASLHEQAWEETFRRAFGEIGRERGIEVAPFGDDDYRRLVDGRLRLEGVRAVVADRGLPLEDGTPGDAPGSGSAWAIANAKDARFLELLETVGPRPFPTSVELLRRLRRAGVPTAVVTASRHCDDVLASGRLADLFDAEVDGWVAAAMHLAGKPAPDTFLEAASRLGARPDRSAVFEDATAGVAAGRNGGFAFVVGVDRRGTARELAAAGAHAVVADLGELRLAGAGPSEDAWHLEEAEDETEDEGSRETLATLGNGYVATRGARPYVVADATQYPGTYFAGVYDRATTRLGGQLVEEEAIVKAPNWLPFRLSAASGGPGPATAAEAGGLVEARGLRLDLRRGLLERRYVVLAGGTRTSVLERRLVSMAEPHLAAMELTLVAEGADEVLELVSELDASAAGPGIPEERPGPSRPLEVVGGDEVPPDLVSVAVRTRSSRITLAEAARTTVVGEAPPRRFSFEGGRVRHRLAVALEHKGRLTVEKVVGLASSRDVAGSEPAGAARAAAARPGSFASLLDAHEEAWAQLWGRAGIELGGAPAELARRVNLRLFHLLQVVSPHVVGRDVGLPAGGLHGEACRGHVLWDEVFVLPMLSLRLPEVAHSLLGYRYRRLQAARDAARALGHGGAMFPAESGSEGREEAPTVLYNPRSGHWVPDRSRYGRHVGLAVAFNFWRHFEATGDLEHLAREGVPVMVEVARFFSSLASFDKTLGRHRIRGVVGPDRFHDGYPWSEDAGVDDNAYTNVMAAWLFSRLGELAGLLEGSGRAEVLERLGLGGEELERFEVLSRGLYVPFLEGGVIAQFEGYGRLEPLDLAAYRARYGSIARLDLILEAEGDSVRRYQVAQQADVLVLLYLLSAAELEGVLGRLGYGLADGAIARTISYYSERAVHGSPLSPVVHAWVAARHDREGSWRHLDELLRLGIHAGGEATAREGIELGALAGTVDVLTRCYTGLEAGTEALSLSPRLPPELDRLAFSLGYRGHHLHLEVDHGHVAVEARDGPGAPAHLLVEGRPYSLRAGSHLRHELAGS